MIGKPKLVIVDDPLNDASPPTRAQIKRWCETFILSLSQEETEVIRHALCANMAWRTGRQPKAYRNHFCAAPGHSDWDVITGLVNRDLMRRAINVPLSPYTMFEVTEAGAQAAGMELPEETTYRKQRATPGPSSPVRHLEFDASKWRSPIKD